MNKTLLLSMATSVLLAACSPAGYKVNPEISKDREESMQEVQEVIPEEQQVGYMRILKDLRWDELTSKEEWMKRFPDCLSDAHLRSPTETQPFLNNWFSPKPGPNGDYERDIHGFIKSNNRRECKNFTAGGVPLNINYVNFGGSTGTKSKMMTVEIRFNFYHLSQRRALTAALANKYSVTTDGHCSKYTCWELNMDDRYGKVIARPTPYTVSLLDKVKIDISDL